MREKRILRKILGPRKLSDGSNGLRSNEKIYKGRNENLTTTMKKRLKFYGRIFTILNLQDAGRLTKRIYIFLTDLKNDYESGCLNHEGS